MNVANAVNADGCSTGIERHRRPVLMLIRGR